jgi:hypothetical protein
LHAQGIPLRRIAAQLDISRAAIREWVADPDHALSPRAGSTCFVCAGTTCPDPAAYAYLLGQYLGDGYLVTSTRVPKLRIACANDYPGIAATVDESMRVLSGNRVTVVQAIGCTDRGAYWMHWPCLLPQHGPGRKHDRPIVLAPWQQAIVDEYPWALVRGLLHSDGCRATNVVRVRGKQYSYPRWFFSNKSRDILQLLGRTLDAVGVEWRYNRRDSISIAKRGSVALVDAHVGPKS